MTTIGLVGLGAMGGRIAGRLLAQDHVVHGTNRTKAKADPLITQGLVWCDTPRAAAQGAEVVISMVTDGEALESVADCGRRCAAVRSLFGPTANAASGLGVSRLLRYASAPA